LRRSSSCKSSPSASSGFICPRLGLGHGASTRFVGKKVALITRSDKDIPSDIKHYDYIPYIYDPEGVETLMEKLRAFLKTHFKL